MKKSFLLSAFLFSFAINAQTGRVGINTENPKATLHIEASASNPNILDGVIPPKLLGNELKLKNYTIDQKGAIVFITAIPDSLSGQVIEINSPGFYYFDGLIWKSFNGSHNLEDVVSKGNYSPNFITFIGSSDSPLRDGAIGMNPNTYSMYFGNMNPNHTGTYNQSVGYNSLAKITTGEGNNAFGFNALANLTTAYQNAAFGTNAGGKITTGTFNSSFGFGALGKTTSGYKNNAFGFESGFNNTTGKLNNFLGSSAGQGNSTGSLNNYIGAFSGQGVNGNNNVMIGTGAGLNSGSINNKLVIHGNTTLSGFGPGGEEHGTYTNINESNISNALIVGDFAARWLRVNGKFQINPTLISNATSDFKKNIVFNTTTGELGITDFEDAITTAGTKVGKPLFGQIEYAGGDTVGYENTYGFYSANENKVSGFTIQNDGDIIPSIYVKDKLSDEVINYLEVLGGQINVKSPISMSQASLITQDYQLVPKIWVENLVNSKLTVPAPPTVGSYTLTAVNGVMQWVAN